MQQILTTYPNNFVYLDFVALLKFSLRLNKNPYKNILKLIKFIYCKTRKRTILFLVLQTIFHAYQNKNP